MPEGISQANPEASSIKGSIKSDRAPRETWAVHVRFAPSEGRRLRRPEPTSCPGEGPLWTERPILMERADGTYELIGTSGNLDGLARWVLSFGTSAEVRGPDRLQRRVAAQARRIGRKYPEDRDCKN
ncbi:hypothetical protein BSZ35_18100 [Salinibacter sp. 10B]|uniref:WYL domain-containing protein n=1 Tax=Salinibacter sp. 10B TaxID=1923971 RepID=UPI000CF3AD6A|nr:WYL domain-containing protein [Salinibacter sp. 10B]PQJ26844.1 hypothetical protein BSZ35_18100 [Salinibacter sp. 10B]